MIRVVHLLSGLQIGGKERVALRLARQGRKQGCDHQLVLFDHPFRSIELDLPPGDVPTHFVQRPAGLSLGYARRIAGLLLSLGADVVHAHNDTALVYAAGASLLCRLARRPVRVIATFHNWPSHASANARRLTWLASHVARTVAVSDPLQEQLTRGRWLSRCGAIWNGVDPADFSPGTRSAKWRERFGIEAHRLVLGVVARLDPVKRHADLVAAARLLQARGSDVSFLVIGRGSLRDELRRMASGLPFLHWIDSVEDMPGLYRDLDGLILCSAQEGAPLALLEAMACGVPVIATAVGGIPHLVASPPEPEAGIFVPPANPEALAAAIEAFAASAERRKGYAEAALARAGRFSFAREWSGYRLLYAGDGKLA